jgi:hypothetical protein
VAAAGRPQIECAPVSHFHHGDTRPSVPEHGRGALGVGRRTDLHPRQDLRFDLVGRDHIHGGIERVRQRRRGGGIEADDDAGRPGQRGRAQHGLDRNLELYEQHPCARDDMLRLVHIRDRQPGIGARRDHDHVAPLGINADEGDARRGGGIRAHVARVDAVAGQRVNQLPSKRIRADPADHGHGRAEARGGDRLVGSFAAGADGEGASGDGLAGPRQTTGLHHEVHVEAADD